MLIEIDLDELHLVDIAVQQLRNCPSEAQDLLQVHATCAALKLASLLLATQPTAVNDAVANTVRIILAMHSDVHSRLLSNNFEEHYDLAHKVWEEAFHTLEALFVTSGNKAAEAANRAGASTRQFKAVAERLDGGAVVLKRLHDAAVAAADAAMAALVMEEESERSAAAKPRKSKKKSKAQASGASAAPAPASPAAAAAASPASAPPAAAAPLPPPAPVLPPTTAAAVAPPAAALPAATPWPSPPLAAAAASPLSAPPVPVPPPPAPAATPPPLPAYLTAARVAAAAPRAPPAPPPAAALQPLRAAAAPALPLPAAPAGATKECCVCLEDVAAADLHLLFPCSHRCVCEACAAAVMAADPAARRCPKCRAAVVGAARVYEE